MCLQCFCRFGFVSTVLAFVPPFCYVDEDVVIQGGFLRELLVTCAAYMWFFSCVFADVLGKVV
jgi:hypothetical protein